MEPVKQILASLEPTVRRCATGRVKEDGFFLLSVRAAFAKNYEVNQFIQTRDAQLNAFAVTSALRGICEDIIALKWLATLERRERDEAVGVMMMKSVLELMQQQTLFFGKYRPSQPILEAKDVTAEVQALKQRLRGMRKGNRWRKHREWPSVREMAEPTGLVPLYDFLYAATSSFVHFSPNNLLRMGKVAPGEERMHFSTSHFSDYYGHFNRFYGLFLFITFCTTFGATLGCRSEMKPPVERLMKHLDEELRWPELITMEEMNVPEVSQMLRLMAHKARKLATAPKVWEWEEGK
ncbi:MAG TPA: DUF5677 domain-containing protein [Tepidisphaeraceae bacterium]|nr:DUF5677 domain-containing protein [Tepidisphaeraceae bacterium]